MPSQVVPIQHAFIDLCLALRSEGIGDVPLPVPVDVAEEDTFVGPFAIPMFRERFAPGRSFFQVLPSPQDRHLVTGWTNRQIEAVCAHLMRMFRCGDRAQRLETLQYIKRTQSDEGSTLLEVCISKSIFNYKTNMFIDRLLDSRRQGYDTIVRLVSSSSWAQTFHKPLVIIDYSSSPTSTTCSLI
jgi:hypothetical protein